MSLFIPQMIKASSFIQVQKKLRVLLRSQCLKIRSILLFVNEMSRRALNAPSLTFQCREEDEF